MTNSEKTMSGFIAVFLSGALWPSLPQISLFGLVVIGLFFTLVYRFSAWLLGILVGFIWVCATGYYYLDWQINNSYFQQNIVVEGTVLSLLPPLLEQAGREGVLRNSEPSEGPQRASSLSPYQSIKFNFAIDKVGDHTQLFTPTARLSWFAPNFALQQGDKLRLFIRLKPPVGLANPHGFNYQQWLTSKNIVAIGYVRDSPSNALVNRQLGLRQQFVNRLLTYNLPNIRWILALSYGDRRLLKPQDWELMQHTGTAHLFAISGMHLGIVFGFSLLLLKAILYVRTLLFTSTLTQNYKPYLLIPACCMCIAYAYISGFEVPVLRALFTLSFWTWLVLTSLYWRFYSVMLALLTSFFVLFPYSILGISFWFSFIAVMLIALFVWRFPIHPNANIWLKIRYGVKLQLFLSLATLPMISFAFGSVPLLGFVANLFMIPIVTFILVPLCLVGAVASALSIDAGLLYKMIDTCFELVFSVLQGLQSRSFYFLELPLQQSTLMANVTRWVTILITYPTTMLLAVAVMLPPWYKKWCLVGGAASLSAMHLYFAEQHIYEQNASHLLAMDVGQGSAFILHNTQGIMLYDTGGAFDTFSMANSVVLPYFRAHDITQLDYFILSHLDNDHAGGAAIIENELNVVNRFLPEKGCNRQDFLKQFPSGTTKLMSFSMSVLWPLSSVSGHENAHSCVIKLAIGKHSILLTGDIEKESEAAILRLYGQSKILQSSILIAPHHGSKTSSTSAFVAAVSPQYVVFSSGANNRWGFPAKTVLDTYARANSKVFITGQQGRIKIHIDEQRIRVTTYRDDEYNRWFFKVR